MSSNHLNDKCAEEINSAEENGTNDEELMTEEELEKRRSSCKKLKDDGNCKFRESSMEEAVELYTQAISQCPKNDTKELSILYSNRAAALFHLDGNKDNVLLDCTKSIQLNPNYIKPYIRRASVYRSMGKDSLDNALSDYQKVLELDPSVMEAKTAVFELSKEIEERNQKMQQEMISSLKTVGNKFLNLFGLSVDNFECKKNESTGGYSINFKK